MLFLCDIPESTIVEFRAWGLVKELTAVKSGLVKRGGKTFIRKAFKRNQWSRQVGSLNKVLKAPENQAIGDDFYNPILLEGYADFPASVYKSKLLNLQEQQLINESINNVFTQSKLKGTAPNHREFGQSIYIDKNTSDVFKDEIIEGSRNAVSYKIENPDIFTSEIEDFDYLNVHSHPAAGSFSLTDIDTYIRIKKNSGLKTVKAAVVTNRGSVFISKPRLTPDEAKIYNKIDIGYAVNNTLDDVNKKFGNITNYKKEVPNISDRFFIESHLNNKNLAKYEYIEYEAHLSQRDKELVKKYKL